MKLLLAIAIGGAVGTTVLPHIPMPHERGTPFSWVERELTFDGHLWNGIKDYPRWMGRGGNPLSIKYE